MRWLRRLLGIRSPYAAHARFQVALHRAADRGATAAYGARTTAVEAPGTAAYFARLDAVERRRRHRRVASARRRHLSRR